MKRATVMYAHAITARMSDKETVETLTHFAKNEHITRLYNSQSTVYKVLVEESDHNDPLKPWGWWKFNNLDGTSCQEFVYVYYTENLFEMCFPYGTKACEKPPAQGIKLPVDITVLKTL